MKGCSIKQGTELKRDASSCEEKERGSWNLNSWIFVPQWWNTKPQRSPLWKLWDLQHWWVEKVAGVTGRGCDAGTMIFSFFFIVQENVLTLFPFSSSLLLQSFFDPPLHPCSGGLWGGVRQPVCPSVQLWRRGASHFVPKDGTRKVLFSGAGDED